MVQEQELVGLLQSSSQKEEAFRILVSTYKERRIATNEAITFINKRAKRQHITNSELQQRTLEGLQTDVYFEGDAIQIQLQKAIATLPEKQQLVFNMKYFDDHTYQELSEILETSVGGLKSNYHIAVKKITAYLQSNETIL